MRTRLAVMALVAAFAFFHFSDITADPDLWGHVLFGYRTLHAGIERTEPFSWTATGHPWINHEVLAEAAMATIHKIAGSHGLWTLTVILGLMTTGIAWRTSRKEVPDDAWWVPAAVAMVASVQIAFGFAARPQIFSALFLAFEIKILHDIHKGRWKRALILPPLFALWINTHGGALAGILLLGAVLPATLAEVLWRKRLPSETGISPKLLLVLLASFAGAGAALLINPWGGQLILWLIQSVSWIRPEIQEWNPTPLTITQAPFFILIALAIAAFVADRLRSPGWWRWAVLGLLAVMGWQHVRHTALFAIAALALIPTPLVPLGRQLAAAAPRMRDLFDRTGFIVMLWFVTTAIAALAFYPRSGLFASITVPRSQYPMNAVRFMQDTQLRGNLLCYFDWGELCLWELPQLRVSVDGRLDTCYPRSILDDHWAIYRGNLNGPSSVDLSKADVALLHQKLPVTTALAAHPGWTLVYADPLAAVLVRDAGRYAKLRGLSLPVVQDKSATLGYESFPKAPPENSSLFTPARVLP